MDGNKCVPKKCYKNIPDKLYLNFENEVALKDDSFS
jgi:hypothetical protein